MTRQTPWLLLLVACGGARPAPLPPSASRPASQPAPLAPVPPRRTPEALAEFVHSDDARDWDGSAPPLTAREARSLVAVWRGFVEAITARDGARAAEALARDSLLWWSDVRTEALTPDAAGRLSVVERLYAEIARQRVPEAELRVIDGQGLFERAVEQGWAAPRLLVGDLSVPVERVTLRHGGVDLHSATERYGAFARLDAWERAWAVAFPYLLDRFDRGATDAATALGLTEDQYISAVARGIVESLPR